MDLQRGGDLGVQVVQEVDEVGRGVAVQVGGGEDPAADQLRLRVGDRVRILGRPFTLVGLSTGGTNIANTTVFIPTDDFARLPGSTQAYVLVGARPGIDLEALRPRLEGSRPG